MLQEEEMNHSKRIGSRLLPPALFRICCVKVKDKLQNIKKKFFP